MNEVERVERLVAQWTAQRPDVDASPIRLISQLHSVADQLRSRLVATQAESGLRQCDFDVLSALRRAGEPFALSPGEIAEQVMVTAGAITKQVSNLEARELVRTDLVPGDGRRRLVQLTPQGRAIIDIAYDAHMATERHQVELISPEQRSELVEILQEWSRRMAAPSITL